MTNHFAITDLLEQAKLHREAPSKLTMRVRYLGLLVVLDVLAVFAGFGLGRFARFGTFFPDHVQPLVGAFLPIFLMSAMIHRAYSGEMLLDWRLSVSRGLLSALTGFGVLALVLIYVRLGSDISRGFFAYGMLFSALLIAFSRWRLAAFAQRKLRGSLYSQVVIADGPVQRQVAPARPIDTSTFFDPDQPGPDSLHMLAQFIGKADRVIIYCRASRRNAWAHVMQGMNVHAEIVVHELSDIRPQGVGSFRTQATLVVARGPLGLRERMIKRLFDLAFSSAALLVLSPLLLLVAVAIKLDSPGPVFFRQPRIGRQNQLFHVFKFRSMRNDLADVGGVRSAEREDPRVTRVGRFIRRTSIDELPQFINVILGDMSIVGPRPHAVHSTAEEQLFWNIHDRYWHRHACKPGITGLAQIMGYRGATHRKSDLTSRVDADLDYLQRWSFWKDIRIILDTVRCLRHDNAF